MHRRPGISSSPEATIDQCITGRFCPTGVITVLSRDLLPAKGDELVCRQKVVGSAPQGQGSVCHGELLH